ncbi:hypothetical protein DL768_002757 [Monosporascus sp. mg162]|nr:hypothetical protein DL768_002757 [Monosporascus sp. mg162]
MGLCWSPRALDASISPHTTANQGSLPADQQHITVPITRLPCDGHVDASRNCSRLTNGGSESIDHCSEETGMITELCISSVETSPSGMASRDSSLPPPGPVADADELRQLIEANHRQSLLKIESPWLFTSSMGSGARYLRPRAFTSKLMRSRPEQAELLIDLLRGCKEETVGKQFM